MLLAPSVHATGPGGAYSIAGSMSYENLFLVNGVTVNENLRGQAHDLYIEDAIQETTIATAGISAEYGRFGGGVVNVITKSGGNPFSGSLRDTLNNDNWRGLTPFAGDSKLDKLLPTYEYTLGGPVMKDRLWFFTAGRLQNLDERRTLAITNVPYDFSNRLRRYEAKATYSVTSGHRLEGAYTRSAEAQTNATFNPTTSMDTRSLYNANRVMDLATVSYSGVVSPSFFVEARLSARNETLENVGATVDRSHQRHLARRPVAGRAALLGADLLRGLRSRRARQPGRLRQGVVLPVEGRRRVAQPGLRLRRLQRPALCQQSSVGQRLPDSRHLVHRRTGRR